MAGIFITIFVVVFVGAAILFVAFMQYRNTLREAKNYERGLKMIPLRIHLPPASEDTERGQRDEREINDELISEAQVMYNIIASTATKGFKNKIYGQRHIAFEIVARSGLIDYYAVVPTVLIDVIKQAIAAAYPSARLEEVAEHNVFSQTGKMTGTIGGEFTLKKNYVYPIATYQESKRDASRALLNALSAASREDGAAIQLLLRPAKEGWVRHSIEKVKKMKEDKAKGKGLGSGSTAMGLAQALWKPPEVSSEKHPEEKQLTALEQSLVEAIEEKTRYPGYEVLVRVVVSSNTTEHSQGLLKNIVAAFSLFDSPTKNGFTFTTTKNVEDLVTSFIFRFFPQSITYNILNSVELATIFHLPDQKSIPTSQVQRQMSKQVDGPTDLMDEGILLGVNEFRGVKKEIRLSDNDRRRHTYIIGQTGVGKSGFLENLALQDMLDGRGFAFIDPHGDVVEKLLANIPKERVEDVIYFNPGDLDNPVGLNLFEYETEDQKDFLVQESINMLYSLYDPGHTGIVGPRMEHIFRNCALLLMSDPQGGTFIDIPKLLVDDEFMKSKLKYVTDRNVLDFWTKEYPASQKSNESGEVTSWVVSKFGPFLSNTMMRNIMGQTKSGFKIRDIMDNRKILLVNLSKGKMGELNSKLIGMIFVMKFQVAAMARADMSEKDRLDFCLFVDEFQNFATESFESILSEARKYRLNLVLGNQFMTQLTEKIREAIIGNVGTVISGRIGVTDAELMVKKFSPTFDAEDLTKLPNYQAIASVMINNVPSAPFSMSLLAPMARDNGQLADAMKRLSATKYGFTRAAIEREIFARLDTPAKPALKPGMPAGPAPGARPGAPAPVAKPAGGNSFLDEWLTKRQQLANSPKPVSPAPVTTAAPRPVGPPTVPPVMPTTFAPQSPVGMPSRTPMASPAPVTPMPFSGAPSMPKAPVDTSPPMPASFSRPTPVSVTPSPAPVVLPTVLPQPITATTPTPVPVVETLPPAIEAPLSTEGGTSLKQQGDVEEISVRLR